MIYRRCRYRQVITSRVLSSLSFHSCDAEIPEACVIAPRGYMDSLLTAHKGGANQETIRMIVERNCLPEENGGGCVEWLSTHRHFGAST